MRKNKDVMQNEANHLKQNTTEMNQVCKRCDIVNNEWTIVQFWQSIAGNMDWSHGDIFFSAFDTRAMIAAQKKTHTVQEQTRAIQIESHKVQDHDLFCTCIGWLFCVVFFFSSVAFALFVFRVNYHPPFGATEQFNWFDSCASIGTAQVHLHWFASPTARLLPLLIDDYIIPIQYKTAFAWIWQLWSQSRMWDAAVFDSQWRKRRIYCVCVCEEIAWILSGRRRQIDLSASKRKCSSDFWHSIK